MPHAILKLKSDRSHWSVNEKSYFKSMIRSEINTKIDDHFWQDLLGKQTFTFLSVQFGLCINL